MKIYIVTEKTQTYGFHNDAYSDAFATFEEAKQFCLKELKSWEQKYCYDKSKNYNGELHWSREDTKFDFYIYLYIKAKEI